MQALRRALGIASVILALYAAIGAFFGPLALVHAFVAVTAIDQWHPNWPSPAVVDRIAYLLSVVSVPVAIMAMMLYALFGHLASTTYLPARSAGMSSARGVARLVSPHAAHLATREGFRADLVEMLCNIGIAPERALEVADAAMRTADGDDASEWAAQVRQEALRAAAPEAQWTRVLSREQGLDQTAGFLRDYGYRVTEVRRVPGGGPHDEGMNFCGLLVEPRSAAHAAEEALIELLITAHQAYMAAVADNGAPDRNGDVERHAAALRRVSMKLALRGFVPPELDAEIGRDGIATAEELERWATAQVVAACSPMTRMPLPTMERTLGGGR